MDFVCGRIHYHGLYRIAQVDNRYLLEEYDSTCWVYLNTSDVLYYDTMTQAMDNLIRLVCIMDAGRLLDTRE